MPRRSSGRSRSAPSAAAHGPLRKPPPPAAPAPPPATAQGRSVGGLGSVVAEGMAFGGGSAIAHRAADGIMGPRHVMRDESVASPAPAPAAESVPTNSDACGVQSKAFTDCLNYYGSDISKCQFYMDMLSECRKNSASGLSA